VTIDNEPILEVHSAFHSDEDLAKMETDHLLMNKLRRGGLL
jgi:hypothetical protein